MKWTILFIFIPLYSLDLYCQKIDYASYSDLLNSHVSDIGKVDYPKLKKNSAWLNTIVESFSMQKTSMLISKEERLAYWINVYNVNTLKLMVDNYPLKSILDLDGGKTWDVKRIRVDDALISLNQIENEIIRPVFKDPRIHFALNCAAKSCPPLFNKAFIPADLETVLDNQTTKFIQSFKQDQSGKLLVSKLFDWYKSDFVDVIGFINKYTKKAFPSNKQVLFEEYDWNLNEE